MKKSLVRPYTPCPCGSGSTYLACCGVWHQGLSEGVHAPDAEALMRSRYCAYVFGLPAYLLATWHPSTAPGELELPPIRWLDLEVRHARQSDAAGVVEFVARCRNGGQPQRLHEISRFVREEGRWYYIDGQIIEPDIP